MKRRRTKKIGLILNSLKAKMIFAKHDYIARKKKWLGVIYEEDILGVLVISLCESDTEKGVIEEIERQMEEQPWKIDA